MELKRVTIFASAVADGVLIVPFMELKQHLFVCAQFSI